MSALYIYGEQTDTLAYPVRDDTPKKRSSEEECCWLPRGGAVQVCSHQQNVCRDLQSHGETEESDVKSLGVRAGN